jgi:hypothetical protein
MQNSLANTKASTLLGLSPPPSSMYIYQRIVKGYFIAYFVSGIRMFCTHITEFLRSTSSRWYSALLKHCLSGLLSSICNTWTCRHTRPFVACPFFGGCRRMFFMWKSHLGIGFLFGLHRRGIQLELRAKQTKIWGLTLHSLCQSSYWVGLYERMKKKKTPSLVLN